MSGMRLVIGNKLYSSWSMRPWLVLKAAGIPFEEEVIPLDRPDTRSRILERSPAGKVPVLIDDDVRVWETLAIIEYLAEKHPEAGIWPAQRSARAHARAICNEMHAGFQALRQACPMNLGKRMKPKERGDAARADIARILALWSEARARFGEGGPFLFGAFTAADAMYAPVVSRFDTYQIAVDAPARAYMEAVMGHPAFVAWRSDALREPWIIAKYEIGETPAEVFHQPSGQ
jgi:glutathione S-transferase